MQSIDSNILNRIYGFRRGAVFTPGCFFDLGSRAAVDKVLSRLVQKGTIRRLARGLYDYPERHPAMGILAPSPDAIARALAGKEGIRLQPSGAYAANRLGLSPQVPARIVYLTDGSSRTVKVGNQEIRLQRTTPRNMGPAGRISGLVIQALRHLGQKHVDDAVIQSLSRKLSDEDKKRLMMDIAYAPAWVGKHLREIALGEA
ncbi:MAG: hypothetical protein JXL20_10755 [Deltaproteobacteria bacterium]|nr:hypothetical protein [Deltaproteobacteria bacterium]